MAAAGMTAVTLAGATAGALAPAGQFVPRQVYTPCNAVVRTWFAGHQHSALNRMRQMLSTVNLVIECRDSRVPLSSTNPLLEQSLMGMDRIIVYTRCRNLQTLHGESMETGRQKQEFVSARQELLRRWTEERNAFCGSTGKRATVVFTEKNYARSVKTLLAAIKEKALARDSLTGLRALIVGMPNSGKSSLLNVMRKVGCNGGPAARTGSQPGITRKMASPVRIVDEDSTRGIEQGIYVFDSPGVFVPYVADVQAMMRLCLAGCVRNKIIDMQNTADYLLYHLNLQDPRLYGKYCAPTNDVQEFLTAIAKHTGKLQKGGVPNIESAANWVVDYWRRGNFGLFPLDDLSEENLVGWARSARGGEPQQLSMHQARKLLKETNKIKRLEARQAQ